MDDSLNNTHDLLTCLKTLDNGDDGDGDTSSRFVENITGTTTSKIIIILMKSITTIQKKTI